MTIGAVLGIAFIVLRVMGIIDWDWWVVVSPIWGEITLGIIAFILGFSLLGVVEKFMDRF